MANVKFANISEDLTAPGTPWIYYGVRYLSFSAISSFNADPMVPQGSYAGARSAHMKVRYPDLVYGAIASSGVTYATVVDWQYYDIIRQFAPSDCVKQIETTIEDVDNLVTNPKTVQPIKALFGLPNVTHNQDFVSLLAVRQALYSYHISASELCLPPGTSWRMAERKLGPCSEQQRLRELLRCPRDAII